MISLIICSRTPTITETLKTNIKATVGVAYEIVLIDNSANSFNIFEAYNLGVKQSKYPYLCFMHDDIIYHTENWGALVLRHFGDEKTGAIGIAGTPYVPYLPGSWWGGDLVNINILPIEPENKNPIIHKCPPTSTNKNKVVVLDGVWFCIRKTVFESISFDEVNYSGFHHYDVDTSMQVSKAGYDVYCVFDILVQHLSKGDMNKTWLKNALVFNKKWKSDLPATCIPLKYNDRCKAELKTLNELATIMTANGVPQKKAYRTVLLLLLKYFKIYFYYKTPAYLSKYLAKTLNVN